MAFPSFFILGSEDIRVANTWVHPSPFEVPAPNLPRAVVHNMLLAVEGLPHPTSHQLAALARAAVAVVDAAHPPEL